jgi:hypothetical protein
MRPNPNSSPTGSEGDRDPRSLKNFNPDDHLQGSRTSKPLKINKRGDPLIRNSEL